MTAALGQELRPVHPDVPAIAVLAVGMGYPLVRQLVLSFQQFGRAQQFGQRLRGSGSTTTRRLVTDRTM